MIYTPDFLFTKLDGTVMYVEAKGLLDNEARRKMVAVKKAHPDKDIRFLFQRDSFVRKGAKNRYSDWAKQNKFPCAIGIELPATWVKEIDIAKDQTCSDTRLSGTSRRKHRSS